MQDVVARGSGELLSRCFVSAASLAPLEGHISASLMTPRLQVTPHRTLPLYRPHCMLQMCLAEHSWAQGGPQVM